MGYTPNEIAIFRRDNDQQNHWVIGYTTFSDKPISSIQDADGDGCHISETVVCQGDMIPNCRGHASTAHHGRPWPHATYPCKQGKPISDLAVLDSLVARHQDV